MFLNMYTEPSRKNITRSLFRKDNTLLTSGTTGGHRTLRFPTSEHPDWEVHPDVPEGDYIRSLSPIPMTGVTTVDKWTVDK